MVGTDREVHIVGKQKEKFANLDTTVEGTLNMSVGSKLDIESDGKISVSAQSQLELGGQLWLAKGNRAVMEFCEICLKCGGSFIRLTDSGIWIQGPFVHINSGGAASDIPDISSTFPVAPADPSDFAAVAADEAKTGFPSAPTGQ
jgi:hypothetical protein